jgi:hypothetical protein
VLTLVAVAVTGRAGTAVAASPPRRT